MAGQSKAAIFLQSRVSSTGCSLVVALILAAGLGGCVAPSGLPAPKAVSLEEAKKITAEFEEKILTRPPRTINDITRVLSQERQTTSRRLKSP